ncbi:ESPR-type extended signal peptide-containing protein [Phascolarctobacterium sp.]|uniref:ESPR-type extended signal peptide-containing protein n=1 Tax=Phascolarctobacterium sp. TaxID=2049039 RepID=UPI003866FDC1
MLKVYNALINACNNILFICSFKAEDERRRCAGYPRKRGYIMNKIYKVVWSKVKNCYVVVSEVAKNIITGGVKSAKIGSAPMTKGLALGAAMAFVITGSAMANEVITADKTDPIKNVYVKNNGGSAPAKGGALQIVSSKVTIEDSYFEANHAIDRGASIHTGEGAEVIIKDSEFKDHKLVNKKPYGAIYAQSGSKVTLDGVVFDGNDTTCVHLDDSELILKGSNAFLNTNNNAIVMTDGDKDLVNTQPILTFAQNSNTLFSGGSGYDFGTTKNFGVINVESGATVVSEGGFTTHNSTVVNLNNGTIKLGGKLYNDEGAIKNNTVIGTLDGENGTIAIDADWFGADKKALTITMNKSTGTVIKARDLDLKGGAAQVLKNVVDDLKDAVEVEGSELVFATAAVDSVLRGDVELKDGKVTTTMDTDNLVVAGTVRADGFTSMGDVYAFDGKDKFNSLNETAAGMEANKQAIADTKADIEEYRANTEREVNDKFGKVDQAIADNADAIGKNQTAIGNLQDAVGKNQTAIGELRDEVGRLDNRIDKVDAKIDKVGAMAAAMASLKTMGYDPEAPTEIAVGVGQYRNETGLAIGAFHYPNKNFMLNFSLSTAGDEVMGGVGATWKIGRKKPAGETMEDKVAKAEAMKKAAKAARVKAQQARHAKMLAEKSK